MKKALLIALVLSAFVMMSCKSIAPQGGATGHVGSKVGEATCTILFGMIPMGDGDYSIRTAAAKGGIKTVGTVDVKTVWPLTPMLPIIVKYTTIVTGE